MFAGLWAAFTGGCGYHSVYGYSQQAHLSVHIGQVLIPGALAAQAAATGARSELAARGQLAGGTDFPRLVIDILRTDELSRGIHVQSGQVHAGGMSVAVTVRGRVFTADKSEPTFDTGDIRRAVQLSGDADPRLDGAVYDVAVRAAAARGGRAVVRAALGTPEGSDEAP